MNRAIVVGAYEFLGFHLTMMLLEQGFEVTGITTGSREHGEYTEDKKLLVGRNANFEEYCTDEWKANGSIEEPHLIFISQYDYYFRQERDLQWEGLFGHLKGAIEETGSKPVFLLPVQYLDHKAVTGCHAVREAGVLEIYLPTLFGLWQPSVFAFQQAIEGKENKDHSSLEDQEDAIHAVEAAAGIIEAAEKNEAGPLLFWSGEEGRWRKCAVHLGIKAQEFCRQGMQPAIEKRIIREKDSYQNVLDKQREYVKKGADPSSLLR
jgi:hypothetical protein